ICPARQNASCVRKCATPQARISLTRSYAGDLASRWRVAMWSTERELFLGCLWLIGTAFSNFASAQLSVVPASPTPLDTARLQWAHVGCTNPDSVSVTMQANM